MPVFILVIALSLIYLGAKGKAYAITKILFTDVNKVQTSAKKNAR